jgi:hypothetical protein
VASHALSLLRGEWSMQTSTGRSGAEKIGGLSRLVGYLQSPAIHSLTPLRSVGTLRG